MSTPFEYGAGFQDGDAFVQDGDGEIMFRLNRSGTTQVLGGPGPTNIVWTTGQGTSVPARYMDVTNAIFTPSAPGWYRFSGQVTVAVVAGATNLSIGLASTLPANTPSYELFELTTAPVVDQRYSFSIVAPIIPYLGVLPGYSVNVFAAGAGVTFAISPSTTTAMKTFLDIEELSMPITDVVQTL